MKNSHFFSQHILLTPIRLAISLVNSRRLVILLIGVIGVQTITSCSDDGGGGGGDCGYVEIGTQTWQKCNLNVVPSVGNSFCYDNDPANCNKYGRLYDWEAANSACPSGSHLPTDEEWDILVNYAGGADIAGDKLKASSGWGGTTGNGTDDYGFSALPGGNGSSRGSFYVVGLGGFWWSATGNGASNVWARSMNVGARVDRENFEVGTYLHILSVRCLKD